MNDGPAPASEADLPSPSPGTEPADWRQDLPADLRRVAEKFASPTDVVRSYAALERRLGRSVVVPDADAPAAEVEAFHDRLGRPATPEGYRAALPSGFVEAADPGADRRLSGFLAAMHRAGATPAVVRAVADWYAAARAEMADDAERRAEAARAAAEATLRRDWGPAYDRKLALARRAAARFGGAPLAALAERSGLGNEPAWIAAFARIGESLAEDTLTAGESAGAAADAAARIDALMAEHFGKPSYTSEAVQGELRALFESLYGTGPARPDAA